MSPWDLMWWTHKNWGSWPTLLQDYTQLSFKGLRNYRLFSIISVPGMVVEEIFLETISKHMKDKEEIRSRQHEFMNLGAWLTQ